MCGLGPTRFGLTFPSFRGPLGNRAFLISLSRMKRSPKLNSNIAETSLVEDQFRGRSI